MRIDFPWDRKEGYTAVILTFRPDALVFVEREDYPLFPVIRGSTGFPSLLDNLRQTAGDTFTTCFQELGGYTTDTSSTATLHSCD